MELSLLVKFPSIIQLSNNKYKGFLVINQVDYDVEFENIANKIIINYKNSTKLQLHREKVEQLLSSNTFSNVLTFLENLQKFLEEIQSELKKSGTENYRAVINDYVEFCQFCIDLNGTTISKDLTNIKLSYKDEVRRNHILPVDIVYNNNQFIYEIESSFNIENDTNLINLYDKFVSMVESLHMQKYYAVLDEIDANCWVVDPEKPSYKESYRRIIIDINTSAVINIYTKSPQSCPVIQFLGPEREIKLFYQRLNDNFDNWCEENNYLEELLKLLEIDNFPIKSVENYNEELLVNAGECFICFSSRLNDKLPDIVCSNSSCNQYYHKPCIYQWLAALNSRVSYVEIYGPCPNCEKTIHCPVMNTNE